MISSGNSNGGGGGVEVGGVVGFAGRSEVGQWQVIHVYVNSLCIFLSI